MRYLLLPLLAFLLLPVTDAAAQVEAPQSAVEVVDWRWYPEPDFGTDGAVRWIVQVANVSRRSIYQAEYEMTTLNGDGQALTTDLGIVQRVAPGDTATINTRADYYGNEERARLRVTNVYFEER